MFDGKTSEFLMVKPPTMGEIGSLRCPEFGNFLPQENASASISRSAVSLQSLGVYDWGASHPIAGNLAKLRPIYRWFTYQIAGCPLYVKLPEWWKNQHISRIIPYKQWLTQWLLSHLRTAHQNTAISCKRWYCIAMNDIKHDFHQWPIKRRVISTWLHMIYTTACAL